MDRSLPGLETRRLRGGVAGMVLAVALLGGCRSQEPAPVDSRDLDGQAPPGYLRVMAGESLSTIAKRQGLDYHRLAEWNGMTPPYLVQAGQLLRIQPPVGAVSPTHPPAGPVPKASSTPLSGGHGQQPASNHPVSTPSATEKARVRDTARPVLGSGPKGSDWQWPLEGKVVQGFRKGDRTRRGIRIAGQAGAKVVAAEAGTVVYSGSGLVGYGNLIILEHPDNYLSAYGFNRKLLVKEGDRVARGEQLAELGQGPSGQHLLHFEIRHKGSAVDPLSLLPHR